MSRSKKKYPYAKVNDSDRWSKQNANRRFRHTVRLRMLAGRDLPNRLKEIADIWGFTSDGGQRYVGKHPQRDKLMRK